MDSKQELALREEIEGRAAELNWMTNALPCGAFVPPDDVVRVLTELEDLQNELAFLRDDPPDPDEPFASVCAPLKPAPHLNSGAIALSEPD